jgi:hypothetical protein
MDSQPKDSPQNPPETTQWRDGDHVPPALIAHARERMIVQTGEVPADGMLVTATWLEHYYPKAEFLQRGRHCCG